MASFFVIPDIALFDVYACIVETTDGSSALMYLVLLLLAGPANAYAGRFNRQADAVVTFEFRLGAT